VLNIIGRHTTKDLIKYVGNNLLPNCAVTRQDILRAKDIFGPNLGSIKVKTTCSAQDHVVIKNMMYQQKSWQDKYDVPAEILEGDRNVTLAVDVMFSNKVVYVLTTSRNIHFATVKDMTCMTITTPYLEQVVKAYHNRGTKLFNMLGDGQFKHINN